MTKETLWSKLRELWTIRKRCREIKRTKHMGSKDNTWGGDSDWDGLTPSLAPPQSPQRSEQQEWTVVNLNPEQGVYAQHAINVDVEDDPIFVGSKDAADALTAAHKSTLAAERQRREQEVYETPPSDDCPTGIKWSDVAKWNGLACEENQKLLLSAQAAIEKHNNSGYGGDYPISIDLSALHEHDAEVRKPLVEALQRITDWSIATKDKQFKLEIEWFGSPVYDPPNRIANDALAKVKEGNRPVAIERAAKLAQRVGADALARVKISIQPEKERR